MKLDSNNNWKQDQINTTLIFYWYYASVTMAAKLQTEPDRRDLIRLFPLPSPYQLKTSPTLVQALNTLIHHPITLARHKIASRFPVIAVCH